MIVLLRTGPVYMVLSIVFPCPTVMLLPFGAGVTSVWPHITLLIVEDELMHKRGKPYKGCPFNVWLLQASLYPASDTELAGIKGLSHTNRSA